MKQSKKLIFILLSFIIVMFSSTAAIVVSNKGSANLLTFESFYAYLVIIVFAIYNILKNKKSNLLIVLALLTYAWTYLLIQQMINNITDVNITISNNFYLYLSSSVFLLFSLFINDNKKKETIEKLSSSGNDFGDSLFLFTSFVLGVKEIPFDSEVLITNNLEENTINLIYRINNSNQNFQIQKNKIKNISCTSRARTAIKNKEVEDNETKSLLLSAVMFGGNPIVQTLGNDGFNMLFNTLSNNYDKVEFNVEYEIIIEYLMDNQLKRIVVVSKMNPKKFLDNILNNKNI
ncbi:unknown [Clostridium sp. CAG:451]|nr:unknown [Clostridium sp. CAG:451]